MLYYKIYFDFFFSLPMGTFLEYFTFFPGSTSFDSEDYAPYQNLQLEE